MDDDFNEIMNRLSENARFALQKADYYSKRYNNGYMGTEHLLLGILAMDTSTGARLLRDEGIDLDTLEKGINRTAVEVPGSQMAMMSLSEAMVLTLRIATSFAKEQGLDTVGTEHLLYALVTQTNSRASLILSQQGVNLDALADTIEELAERQAKEAENKKEKSQ